MHHTVKRQKKRHSRENETFEPETLDPHGINGLLALVGEAQRLRIPRHLQTFKVLGVVGDVVKQPVHVDLAHQAVRQTFSQTQPQDSEGGKCRVEGVMFGVWSITA